MFVMRILFFTLASFFCFNSRAQVDTLQLKMNAKAGMDSVQNSFKNSDWETFTNLMHPDLVKLTGGKSAFKNILQKQMSSLEGATIDSLSTGAVLQLLKHKGQWQCIVLSFMQITVQSTTVTTSSSNIGVSYDNGKSWKFIRVSDGNETRIVKLFPSISGELKIPLNKSAKGTIENFIKSFKIEYPSE